ncbi:SGNH/GDSL hydrolase family protein [Paludicola sp. MB14-C6]|uniref:SGNH/GDSL hydrolase family protein n=1 Tax=Paludihabitans sp. MB14-C6 TaxID=3070656 RepID=UPI0027DC60C9|nr:SGNH/GDSL hydrolase family protein [Paludicola sp. MB14-C6]WMJ23625.1 SGNH/GDSL hydrolase family protein [Paludicola sp. MB14-C6]
MKKVLLLGDSIRMGYAPYVKELLKNQCEVYYDEQDNGRYAAYTLWQANQLFIKYGKFDVVHWNNGYWDMNIEPPMDEPIHPVDEYVHFLKRIIKQIRNNGAEIIFATTLPLIGIGMTYDVTGTGTQIAYDNNSVLTYNKAATELMNQENITINDLYSLMLKDENCYKCEDKLHLTTEGYQVCAKQIAEIILEKLR